MTIAAPQYIQNTNGPILKKSMIYPLYVYHEDILLDKNFDNLLAPT